MSIVTRLRIGVAVLMLVLAATTVVIALTVQQVRGAVRQHGAERAVIAELHELDFLVYAANSVASARTRA